MDLVIDFCEALKPARPKSRSNAGRVRVVPMKLAQYPNKAAPI